MMEFSQLSTKLNQICAGVKQSGLETATQRLWNLKRELENYDLNAAWEYTRIETFNFVIRLLPIMEILKDKVTEKIALKITPFECFIRNIWSLFELAIQKEDKSYLVDLTQLFSEYLGERQNFIPITERKFVYNHKELEGPIFFAKTREDEFFLVSDGFLEDKIVYIDFWGDNYKNWLAKQYKRKIEQIEREFFQEKIKNIYILTKTRGPKGPQILEEELKSILPDKQVLLVNGASKSVVETDVRSVACYDLFVTGRRLREAKQDYQDLLANVVLYKFNGSSKYQAKKDKNIEQITYAIFEDDMMQEAFSHGKPLKESGSQYSNMEDELEQLLRRKDIGRLNYLIELNDQSILEALYEAARSGKLNLKEQFTKDIWCAVFKHFGQQPEKMEKISSELGVIYRDPFKNSIETFLEHLVMGIGTAVFYGDLGKGFKLSERVRRYFDKKQKEYFKEYIGCNL